VFDVVENTAGKEGGARFNKLLKTTASSQRRDEPKVRGGGGIPQGHEGMTYRGTSLIRNTPTAGPYSSPKVRGGQGGTGVTRKEGHAPPVGRS